jgi:hypothetical protein
LIIVRATINTVRLVGRPRVWLPEEEARKSCSHSIFNGVACVPMATLLSCIHCLETESAEESAFIYHDLEEMINTVIAV